LNIVFFMPRFQPLGGFQGRLESRPSKQSALLKNL
jgi:hypothetical protein